MSHDHTHAHSSSESWTGAVTRAALCAAGYAAGWITQAAAGERAGAWVFAAACLPGLYDLALAAWHDLRERRVDIAFLMLTAAGAAMALGHWPEAALLLALFSGSAALERFAARRTERALAALFKETPKTAVRVLDDGTESEFPVEDLLPGMTVRVPPGQQIPVDLEIKAGESDCDESTLTGEAVPVPKHAGDEASGGSLNLTGQLTGRVLRPLSSSALRQIMDLISQARESKARAQRFTDRFGGGYTLLVLAACVALYFAWWLLGGLPAFFDTPERASAFTRAVTVLIVASPCALVLSVPSAVLAAIARGAMSGVIFRGGAALEDLAGIRAVALDKTGTLTTGELTVEEIRALSGDERALRRAAATLGKLSTHPLSRAIARRLAANRSAEEVPDFTNVPGNGVTGAVDGKSWRMGKRSWAMETAPETPAASAEDPPETSAARTEVWLSDGVTSGVITLRDEPRKEARGLLTELHAGGLRTLMLTGDRPEAARGMAGITGVGGFHAALLPADKTRLIQEMIAAGEPVAMIGDGVNDAPSLAAATVGVAMGLRGSDAALREADIVLSNDRLEAFLTAWRLSRRAARVIRQNLILSLGVAGVMVVVTILRPVPLWLGVLSHEGSTAAVVLNSLRLLRPVRPGRK